MEYDQITAFHYSAFRPSLHAHILKEYFGENEKHHRGLDIGSGTGHSSIALTRYCDHVSGIDPSKEMLTQSIKHPRVEYALFDQKNLDFEDDYFDIITFSGSLYYAKSQRLLREVVRVSNHNGKVLVYDFELFLDDVLSMFNVDNDPKKQPNYNHQENFSGLNQENIKIERALEKPLSLVVSTSNLSHLLLSTKDTYNKLLHDFGQDNLYNKVAQKLKSLLKAEQTDIEAMTYSIMYSVSK